MSNVASPDESGSGTCVQVFEGWEVLAGDEPRVRDVDLAERAGMPQPRNVRSIIRKRRATLEQHGPLTERTRRVRSGNLEGSGPQEREVTEYWLTEHQAHHLAFWLRTPKAVALQVEIVRLFVAWRRGELETSFRASAPKPVPAPNERLGRRLTRLSKAVAGLALAEPRPRDGAALSALGRVLADLQRTLMWCDPIDAARIFTATSADVARSAARCVEEERPRPGPESRALPRAASFVAQCEFADDARTPCTVLRKAYEAWCARTGESPLGPRAFWVLFRDRGARSCTVRHEGKPTEGLAGVRLRG